MTRDLEYNITSQDNGVTISDYLKKQGFSHAVTVQLKKIPESILLNGKWEYMSTRLNGGDCLSIHFEETDGSKNIVAAGLADKCEIQLSYAIGVAHPTSIHVETFGTGKLSDTKLVEIIRENFDLRPAGIIKMLDLRRPIYRQTAAYGHFGRTDVDLPWEHLDKVDDLKKYLA